MTSAPDESYAGAGMPF